MTASESYLSDTNHDNRMKHKYLGPEQKKYLEEQQKPVAKYGLPPLSIICPGLQMQQISFGRVTLHRQGAAARPTTGKAVTVSLRGPFHPLECKYICAHRIGSTKEIRIEPESVNAGKCH